MPGHADQIAAVAFQALASRRPSPARALRRAIGGRFPRRRVRVRRAAASNFLAQFLTVWRVEIDVCDMTQVAFEKV